MTNRNRGAFLTDAVQVVEPIKRKESPLKTTKPQEKESSPNTSPKPQGKEIKESSDDFENIRKAEKSKSVVHKDKDKHDSSKSKTTDNRRKSHSSESRAPLKTLKPLSESEEKPFSKVEPLPPKKPKKAVRFSTEPPQVRVFQIEEGNKLKSTKLAKKSLDNIVIRQTPFFSLEKVTLMKILRWNPHWLEEQINNNDPPPILGHNNPPMTIFHSFSNHKQYVQ